ncbi:U3 small nucleolar RNA-associated protein 18 homolog [Geodia barretti]|uniref:U3 small nucleolar RNA-associated protein 18 homolog n=1 Tax=Geodia barretti TaxID=519541 RepID=A0AA35WY21_GEOBA|nr:U3 small nucleolar RNA-associated protein 18 homolog [Geodia barretti]
MLHDDNAAEEAGELSSAGAFIDTTGERGKKRKKIPVQVTGAFADREEEELEALVFGRQLFKRVEESGSETDSSEDESEDEEGVRHEGVARDEPAWRDEDDDELSVDMMSKMHRKRLRQEESDRVVSGPTYASRLRTKFQQLGGDPDWAKRKKEGEERRRERSDSDSDTTDDEGGGLLQRSGQLLCGSAHHRLPLSLLDVKRVRDINRSKRAQAAVKCLEFHPTASVALTAGWHKTLDLFQVDGEANQKLQSVHVQDFPISTAHFTGDGTEVVMSGERKSYYVYDMIAGKITRICGIRGRKERKYSTFTVSPDNKFLAFLGKDGYIIFVSNKTKQWVGELKMNGEVGGVAFTPDSQHLLSYGTDGQVYVWDVASRQCVHRFTDEGCVVGRRVGVSPDGQFVACGSESGIVNVYERSEVMAKESPKPLRAVMNLTTAVDHLQFNSTSEILAVASSAKKDAVKMVHLSSLTVFSNWPHVHSRLGRPTSLHLSPLSRYLALGNERGKALLFRLNHYHQASQN